MNNLAIKKNEVDIDIYSEVFEEMLEDLNQSVTYVLAHLYKQFEGGEITVKLDLSLQETSQENASGDVYYYNTPIIKFNRNVVMKKQNKNSSIYYDSDKEIVQGDSGFILRDVDKYQIDMFVQED